MHFKSALKVGGLLIQLPFTKEKSPYYIDVHFVKLLSFALGFDYELIFGPTGDLGRELENGTWTGLIGMVNRSEIDFAVTPMGTTEERLHASDWSYPYAQIPMTFATLKPSYKTEWLSYLKPFSYIVWVCLIASVIAVSTTFYVAGNGRYNFQRVLLSTYAAVLQNTIAVQPLRKSEYSITIAWLMGVTFTIFCYTALLLSFMTFPTLSGVRTIPDLSKAVTKGAYKCITVPGTFAIDSLKESTSEDIAVIGHDLDRNEKTLDIPGTMEAKSSKTPAFVLSKYPLMPFEEIYFISEDTFFNTLLSMPIRKSFCCKKDLDRTIHYITASGMFWKILHDLNFQIKLKVRASYANKDTDSHRRLSLGEFKGAFAFLIIGYTLSIVVFVIERVSTVIIDRKASKNDLQL